MFKKTTGIVARIFLALPLSLLNASPGYVQTVDRPDRPPPDRERSQPVTKGGDRRNVRLSTLTTAKISRDVDSIRRECGRYNEVYRIDCLRQGIDLMLETLPPNSEYEDAERILRNASGKLGRIVASQEDGTAARLVPQANANPRFKKHRQYSAVKRDAVPQAMKQASAVVDEASTALLRSSENSERRYAHYQEISVAVDSTKTLLRSS